MPAQQQQPQPAAATRGLPFTLRSTERWSTCCRSEMKQDIVLPKAAQLKGNNNQSTVTHTQGSQGEIWGWCWGLTARCPPCTPPWERGPPMHISRPTNPGNPPLAFLQLPELSDPQSTFCFTDITAGRFPFAPTHRLVLLAASW